MFPSWQTCCLWELTHPILTITYDIDTIMTTLQMEKARYRKAEERATAPLTNGVLST
jgi:hypothetical protein